MKMRSSFRHLAVAMPVLAALAFLPGSLHAVNIDLTGQTLKPGGTIGGVSTTPLPKTVLMELTITATGTGTGDFTSDGNLATTLATYANSELCNPTNKIPVTICNKILADFLTDIPIGSGKTAKTLTVRGLVKFKIDAKGYVHLSASKISFAARDSSNNKVPFNGTYKITSGGISITEDVGNSSTAGAQVYFPAGHYLNGAYYPVNLTVPKGSKKTSLFVVKNEGPNQDDFQFFGSHLPTGFTARVFDGTTEITTDAYNGTTGDAMTLASGEGRLIKVIVSASSKATNGSTFFRIQRTAASSTYSLASYNLKTN